MRLAITPLTAAFGLIMSALSVFAQPVAATATITISSLPYTITAPGTYVLVGNLNYTGNGNAITINTPLPGPVVVDLEGYTLNGPNNSSIGIVVLPVNNTVNTAPITIRNGTIQNFNEGISVGPAVSGGPLTGYFSDIKIQKIVFFGGGVGFSFTNSSRVVDCTFTNTGIGIVDYQSQGGNIYINDVFNGFISGQFAGLSFYGILITGNTPYTAEHCHFEAPGN